MDIACMTLKVYGKVLHLPHVSSRSYRIIETENDLGWEEL